MELKILAISIPQTETKRRSHHKQVSKTNICLPPDVQSGKRIIFEKAVEEFESKCQAISHFCCQSCQMTGITIKQSQRNKLLCTTCQASHANKKSLKKKLPIWYNKKGIVQ